MNSKKIVVEKLKSGKLERRDKMRIGYLPCRGCGKETNCADLVSGFCPVCARAHAAALASLQRDYDLAVADGEPGAVQAVGDIITAYERSEGLRLKDAHH